MVVAKSTLQPKAKHTAKVAPDTCAGSTWGIIETGALRRALFAQNHVPAEDDANTRVKFTQLLIILEATKCSHGGG